jgi:dipeptidase
MDWNAEQQRPLYLYRGEYPSTISKHRGATWHPKNLEGTSAQLAAWGEESVITGSVSQVRHTYALIEAGYGIMNEHNVAIGESTCAARFTAKPTSAGGQAMIEVREMSRIALERTRTARECIQLMGDLAVQHGFYGADWSGGDASLGEAGEALTVIDTEEGWVFHVLADDTATSAIWVAQRVPDDHVAVVANMFIIRDVVRGSDDFMYSDNLFDVAEKHGLVEPGAPLDFSRVYGLPRSHSAYCTRRVWRVQSLVAPSLSLNPETDMFASDYAFSVKADVPLGPEDLMRIQRDHYEGTAFDMTKGPGAGPFGDPQRFDGSTSENNMTSTELVQGAFERAISLFRTSYSFVAQARSGLPALAAARVWFCTYAPHSSSYAPFYVSQTILPDAYTRGSLFSYDPSSAFWSFLAAGNYASRFYKFAMYTQIPVTLKVHHV